MRCPQCNFGRLDTRGWCDDCGHGAQLGVDEKPEGRVLDRAPHHRIAWKSSWDEADRIYEEPEPRRMPGAVTAEAGYDGESEDIW